MGKQKTNQQRTSDGRISGARVPLVGKTFHISVSGTFDHSFTGKMSSSRPWPQAPWSSDGRPLLAIHDPAGNQSIAYLVTHTGPLALPRPQQ